MNALTGICPVRHILGMLSLFEVIAEPNRRRILDLLCDQQRSVNELVEALGLNQPAVSKHLKVLKDAQLVEAETAAQRRLYRLRPEPLRELDAWLGRYRKFWSDRLDALGAHLDAMEDEPSRKRGKRRRRKP